MVLKSRENNVGAWFFLIGVVIAIFAGIFTNLVPVPSLTTYSPQIYGLLVILGIIIGAFIKITGKESQTFLLAGTVIVIVSKFGMDSVRGSLIGIGIGNIVCSIFAALVVLFVPATILVALKALFSVAKV